MARGSADRARGGVIGALIVAVAGAVGIAVAADRGMDGDRCADPGAWRPLVAAHLARYPKMELADAYKLLHQATLGSEHAVTSRDAAARWLAEELSDLPDGPEEPLVDPLGDGNRGAGAEVVRIHLRPFVAGGGSAERLATAFFETGSLVQSEPRRLECALAVLATPPAESAWPWDPEEAAAYVAERRAEGFPAVHHGEAYRGAYGPAYRVVAAELVADVIDGVRP